MQKEGELLFAHGFYLRRPEVGIDARELNAAHFRPPRRIFCPRGGHAAAVHARVDGKVRIKPRLGDEFERAGRGKGGGERICPHAECVLTFERRAKDEDGLPNARNAERRALLYGGDAERLCNAIERVGSFRPAVAVSLVLDDGKEGSICPIFQEAGVFSDTRKGDAG